MAGHVIHCLGQICNNLFYVTHTSFGAEQNSFNILLCACY